MEERPVLTKMRTRISTAVIGLVSIVILITGLIILLSDAQRYPKELRDIKAIIGISCLITSAFLFIIVDIANDIQYQAHLMEYQVDEEVYYHTQSLLLLQSINMKMQQPAGAYQPPFMPDPQYMPPQPPYQPAPEQGYQPMPPQVPYAPVQEQGDQSVSPQDSIYQMPDQDSRKPSTKQKKEMPEDSEFDYKAQYKRPEQ